MYHIKDDPRNQTSCRLICDALIKLINRVGFDNINIRVLAETAGVGRATFYRSFDSIGDVLRYKMDRTLGEMVEIIYPELKKDKAFTEYDIYLLFFRYWFERTELIKTLLAAERFWLLGNALGELFRTQLVFIKELLQLSNHAWPFFIKVRTAILTGMLEEWFVGGKKENPQQLVLILIKSLAGVKIDPGTLRASGKSGKVK